MCMVFGEISSSSLVNYEQIVRTAIKEIGYDDLKKGELIYNKWSNYLIGMDFKNATVIVNIDT